jgi:hypothetical protein
MVRWKCDGVQEGIRKSSQVAKRATIPVAVNLLKRARGTTFRGEMWERLDDDDSKARLSECTVVRRRFESLVLVIRDDAPELFSLIQIITRFCGTIRRSSY